MTLSYPIIIIKITYNQYNYFYHYYYMVKNNPFKNYVQKAVKSNVAFLILFKVSTA